MKVTPPSQPEKVETAGGRITPEIAHNLIDQLEKNGLSSGAAEMMRKLVDVGKYEFQFVQKKEDGNGQGS